jgi:Putative MetA-pathway of phenol degradation
LLSSGVAFAQSLCPTGIKSDKLICLIPQVFGTNGLVLPNVGGSHFQNTFLTSNLTALESAIGREAAILPLASPSSGFTFSWNNAAKIFVSSTDSYGPILGDRAETIGRHKLFVGSDYQFFNFNSLDGISLKSLPVSLQQPDDSVDVPGTTCSVDPNGNNSGQCGFIRDVIKTQNRVDLKIHQFTTYIGFGLTNKIDISMAIPIENIRMAITSTATIVDNSMSGVHSFEFRSDCGSITIDPVTHLVVVHPCLNQTFSNARNASGIGDITFRVKGTAWKGEKAAVALGIDIRVPSGDPANYLGAGTSGFKPFVIWSYQSRISPHIFTGYQVNGMSILGGDVTTGTKEKLPGELSYSAGFDVWITKWFTAAVDLLGDQLFEARRIGIGSFEELPACTTRACTSLNAVGNVDMTLSQTTGTFNQTNGAIGVKLRPFSTLLISSNVLLKMNSGGLRATAIPLFGLSYTF